MIASPETKPRLAQGLSPEQYEALKPTLVKASVSSAVFGHAFLKHHLTRPFSESHYKILGLLDHKSKEHRYKVILAPREWGKSTMGTLLKPARLICFQRSPFIVLISQTEKKAKADLATLKREIAYNPRIRRVFGKLKPEGRSANWTSDQFTTTTGVTVMCRGADQQIRGMKIGDARPHHYIVDDFESPKEARSEIMREARKDTFWADIYNSQAFGVSQFDYLATPLHFDALSVNLLHDEEWLGARYEMCNAQFVSKWPEYITDDECREQARLWRARGRYHIWLMEKRCVLHDPTTRGFKDDMLRTISEEDVRALINSGNIAYSNFVLGDPGRCLNPDSSASAIPGGTVDFTNRRVYWWKKFIGQVGPKEFYRNYTSMIKQLETLHFGAEDHGLHEYITEPLEAYLRQQGVHKKPTWLKPRGRDKVDRTGAMLPYFEMGCYYMTPEFKAEVEKCMFEWPYTNWKEPASNLFDAMAYLQQLINVEKALLGLNDIELAEVDALERVGREAAMIEAGMDLPPKRPDFMRGDLGVVADYYRKKESNWDKYNHDPTSRFDDLMSAQMDGFMSERVM